MARADSWSLVTRGARTYTIGSLVSMLTSFLAVPLTVRYLGKDSYGHLVLLLSAYSVGCLALDPGIGGWIVTSISREIGRSNLSRVRALLRTFLLYEVAVCGLLAVVLALASAFAFPNVPRREIALLWAFLASNAASSVIEFTFYGFSDFRSQTRLTVLPGMLRLAGLGVLFFTTQARLDLVWLLYPLSVCVATASSWRAWRKHTRPLPPPEAAFQSTLLREVWTGQPKFFVLFTAVRRAHDNLPIWMIRSILGRATLASYDIAFGLLSAALALLKTMENALLPETTRLHAQEPIQARAVARRAVRTCLLLSLLAVPIGWMLAGPTIRILFGAEYGDAIRPLRILTLSLIPWAILVGQRVPFYSLQATQYLPASYAISTAVLALWLVLFTAKGLDWVAVGYGLDVVLLVFTTGFFLRRLHASE